MLKENKVVKYLLYAIGEIILVTVGILIALQINNKNELHKNEVKVEAILEDIQSEFISDLEDLDQLIPLYQHKDSLIDFVLSGEVTEEDYARNLELFSLLTTYAGFECKANAYENLMRNSDIIPNKYNDIIPLLDELYLENNKNIDEIHNRLSTLVNNTISSWSEKYTWYLDLNRRGQNPAAVDYFLNDPFYKNALATYQIYASGNLLRLYGNHQLKTVLAYKAIQKKLTNPGELPEIITSYIQDLSPEKMQRLTGNYLITPTFGIEVFIEDDQLRARATGQQSFDLYAKSQLTVFNPVVGISISFNEEENGTISSLEITQSGVTSTFKKVEL